MPSSKPGEQRRDHGPLATRRRLPRRTPGSRDQTLPGSKRPWYATVLIGLRLALTLLLGFDLLTGGGLSGHLTRPQAPPDSDQLRYRASVDKERLALFTGTLQSLSYPMGAVGTSFPITVFLCGPDARADRCVTSTMTPQPGATAAAPPSVQATSAPLGGRVEARLTSGDSRIDIVPLHGWPIQPLTGRADVGRWEWSVTASDPGSYQLFLQVTVLAGGSGAEPLVPPETLIINLTAERVSKSDREGPAPTQDGAQPTQNAAQRGDAGLPAGQASSSADAKGIAASDTGWTIEKVIVPLVLGIMTLAGGLLVAWMGMRSKRDAPTGTQEGSTAAQAAVTGGPAPLRAAQPPIQHDPGGRGG
ncbi:hypothetical protein JNW90_01100 [Micromonospora sp. STR1s_5]|nr:hypothetical protein [Micromonospora sp. STR1s_5]